MADESDSFFLVIRGEGTSEGFLEFRFRNGAQLCLPYDTMLWFNYSPDEGLIDLNFGDYLIAVKGRGLVPKLFDAIKARRVAWIREADSEMQDSKDFECFIESIILDLAESSEGEEP